MDGALHVLEYVGVEVHHQEARNILQKAGAWVDDDLRVRIPSYLVKQALSTAPRSFTIYARDGNPKHNIRIGPGPTPPNFTDIDTLERRPYVKNDATIVAKVCDALPNINFVESLGTVSDVHPDLAATYEFATMFPNTTKPIVAWSYGLDDAKDMHQIAIAEAGGQRAFEQRPNYVHYCEPLSPLVANEEALEQTDFLRPTPGSRHLHPHSAGRRNRADHRCRQHCAGSSRFLGGVGSDAAIASRPALFYGVGVIGDGYDERDDSILRRAGAIADDGRANRTGALRGAASVANRRLHRFQGVG